MKSLSGFLPVLAIVLSFDSVRARPQSNGQPILGVGTIEKVERVNLHEKVNSSGSNNSAAPLVTILLCTNGSTMPCVEPSNFSNWTTDVPRVFLDVSNIRGTTEESADALLETSAPQIVADLKISSALTTSAVNNTNDETSRTAVTKPTPIGESLKTVTKQLLHSPSATDMTVTDVRTPPKIKNQLLSHEMIALGKGEAVPVIMEEDNHNYEKLSSPQSHNSQSHVGVGSYSKRPLEDSTSPSGLSTWILLNNDNVHGVHGSSTQNTATEEASMKMTSSKIEHTKTSPATFPENKVSQKKKHKPSSTTPSYSSTEAFITNTKQKEEPTPGSKKTEKKPTINTNVKTSSTTTPYVELYTERLEEIVAEIDPATGEKKPLITLQDSKFKNKTPVIVGRIPQKDKIEASTVTSRTPTKIVSSSEPVTKAVNDNITRFGTPVVTFPHVPPRGRPSGQPKEDEKVQQTKLQLQKQQQQKLQTQYQQKLQQQKIQQQLQEQNTKPISTTMPPLFSPTIAAMTTPKQEAVVSSSAATNATETTMADMTTTSTEAPTITSIKKTKRPSQKKKKNKTRRRRPTKTPSQKNDLESKVSEDANPAAKIPGTVNKPLSTRIYNYLAREVVPNVGVGIVGLMLTAGLAGLLLYPFGGGIAARRTEKFSGNAPDGHNYYYNEYSTTGDMDHGQAEEQVFGQVLAGMSHNDLQYSNAYSRERPSSNNYYNQNNNNKYKPARYETVDDYAQAGIAGFKEDITQENKYSTLGDANKDYNTDVNSKYSPVNNIANQNADPYAITDTESDSSNVNKYVDPTSSSDVKDPKFSAVSGTTADVKTNTKYSSSIDSTYNSYSGQVGHGTVYNDEVGYGDNTETEHKNHRVDYQTHEDNVSMEKIKPSDASDEIITAEDNKSASLTQTSSKEEQPTYSALEGIPKRINYNYGYEKHSPSDETYSESFVPMNVNEPDSFNHRYSLQVEHGPRSMKLTDEQTTDKNLKVRRRRQALKPSENDSDTELENEIDGILLEESASSPSTSVKKTDTTHVGNAGSSTTSESQTEVVSMTSIENSQKKTNLKSTTGIPVTDASEATVDNLNEDDEQSNSADKIVINSTQKPSQPEYNRPPSFSFMDLIKKVAEFKINLGLNILKTTSETLSRYLGTIQSKMVTAMRHINKIDNEIRKGAEKVVDSKNKTHKDVNKNSSDKHDDSSVKPVTNQIITTNNYDMNDDDISHIDMNIDDDASSMHSNFKENSETRIFPNKPSRNLINDSEFNNFNNDCSSKGNCNLKIENDKNNHKYHSIRRRDLSEKTATKKRQNVKKYRPLKKT